MIEVVGGTLYQWDTGRKVQIKPKEGTSVSEVNVCKKGEKTTKTCKVYQKDGLFYADIPASVLDQYGNICVYVTTYTDSGEHTISDCTFKVLSRQKPEDYDANIMFSDTVNEIIGENITGSLADKLSYLKECLDILYQAPPIKLMREVFGEGLKLRELFEYIGEQYSELYANAVAFDVKYSSDKMSAGYSCTRKLIKLPDGSEKYSEAYYISPKICVLPNGYPVSLPFTVTYVYSRYNTLYTIDLVDFSGLKFGNLEDNQSFRPSVYCREIAALRLPEKSTLIQKSIDLEIENTSYACIVNGLHLGKRVVSCSSTWLFNSMNITPQNQRATPVYCDKDFYVNGTMYLEKLNIPVDCLLDVMKNVYDVSGRTDLKKPILSIGSYNLNKIKTGEYEQELNDFYDKGWGLQ